MAHSIAKSSSGHKAALTEHVEVDPFFAHFCRGSRLDAKNKMDRSHGHVTTLMLEIDEATANWLWLPKSLKGRVCVTRGQEMAA